MPDARPDFECQPAFRTLIFLPMVLASIADMADRTPFT
jgi:hypothetical protein